jgi:hypothetical protein
MATLTPTNPELYQGPVMATREIYVADNQTWKAGQFLYTNTSGLLVACASDADAGTGGIKYLALKDQADPNNNTTLATVGVIVRDHVFIINELDGSVDTANIGIAYGIDVTSNVVTLDEGDTGNPALEVVGLMSSENPVQDSATDTKNRALVKVLTTVLEAAAA